MIQIPKRSIETILVDHGIELSPSQRRPVFSNSRVVLTAGGAQAGKTYALAAYVLPRLPFCRLVWIIGPDFSQAKKALSYIAEFLGRRGGVEQYKTPEDGSHVLKTTFGCRAQTMSADNPQTIATEAPDGIAVDEAAQTSREVYERCRERVGPTRGWVFMSGTFEDDKPWYDDLFGELEADGCAFSIPSWENKARYEGGYNDSCPHYDALGNQTCKCNPEILMLRKVLGRKRFDKRIGGRRVQSEVKVYDIFTQEMVALPPPRNETKMIIAGVDYGFGDPTVIEVFGLHNMQWWGLDEFYAPKYTAYRLKDKFDEMRRKWRNPDGSGGVETFFIPHDKPEVVYEYSELCDAENPPRPRWDRCAFRQNGDFKNVLSGIGWVYSLMETGRIHFSPLQQHLIQELRAYSYPGRDSRNKGEKPIDLNNHGPDAVRLAMMGIKDPYERELFRIPEKTISQMTDVERLAFLRRRGGGFAAVRTGSATRNNF